MSAAYHPGVQIDEILARYTTSGQKTLLQDALGSVIAQTAEDGGTVNRYAYSPYGESRTIGADDGNPLQYTGRENDGTGLYYYRARYYDPLLKRFISEDPIGLAGGINVYGYVGGNPVGFVDPDGLFLTALYALQQGMSMNEAAQAGVTGTASVTAGAAVAVTGSVAIAIGTTAPSAATVVSSAVNSPTGRAVVAAGLQALGNAEKAGGLPIPPSLAGSVPTSQSAIINAAAQSARAAQQAAKNDPLIGRPNCPR